MKNTPVLFVEKDSIYKELSNNCFDAERNALNFTGNEPAIYHPPCRLWGRLRGMSSAPAAEKKLATWAVELIRKGGGDIGTPKP